MDQPLDNLIRVLQRNVCRVKERIAGACARAGRSPDEVLLVAVSKGRSPEDILAAYRCGLYDLGENRIEELEQKVSLLGNRLDDPSPIWHMVGHVQSRKARSVAQICDLVHSVDSLRLAQRLDRYSGELGRVLPVLVQVNISGEVTKYGYPAWDVEGRRALVEELAKLGNLRNIQIRGLMTIAPQGAPEDELRRIFAALASFREELSRLLPFSAWHDLSMGMTDDLEIAVEEGATIVRVGRAIFESREQ